MSLPNSASSGIHAAFALLAVGWIVVLLKLSVKFFKDSRQWFLHDLYSILALIFTTAEVIVVGINVEVYGLGYHTKDFPKTTGAVLQLNTLYRMLVQGYVLYDIGLLFVKLAILSFYTNIFAVSRKFKIIARILQGFIVAYLTAFILVDAFRCRPLKSNWDPILDKADFCSDGQTEQIALGILNVLTDFAILLLPGLIIFKLQMSRKKLACLCVIFALGLFTCAAALTRVVITGTTFKADWSDGTWSSGFTVVWQNMEMLVGQICGGLLSVPGLIRRVAEQTSVGKSLQKLLGSGSSGNGTLDRSRRGYKETGGDHSIPHKPSTSGTRSSIERTSEAEATELPRRDPHPV